MRVYRQFENGKPAAHAGFTIAEVVIAAFLLGTLILALFGAFSSGLGIVEASRENMRATQILVQKLETVRLYSWSQATNSALASTNFTEVYDPLSANCGVVYRGSYSAVPAPSSIPAAYRDRMRLVTMTVYWTNFLGSGRAKVQTRQIQTFAARYGMQNYLNK